MKFVFLDYHIEKTLGGVSSSVYIEWLGLTVASNDHVRIPANYVLLQCFVNLLNYRFKVGVYDERNFHPFTQVEKFYRIVFTLGRHHDPNRSVAESLHSGIWSSLE